MFRASETGPEIRGHEVRFRIFLPGIERERGFSVNVYVINKRDQFDANVPADLYELLPASDEGLEDRTWGDVSKTLWQTPFVPMTPGTYLYRFEIMGPARDSARRVRSLYFGDPCARETDSGVFSIVRIPAPADPSWDDGTFYVPPFDDLILYELNVAEFGGTFDGVAERIPYLVSMGVNAIELMPINSIAEPGRWGYMPVFYMAPEERFGGPAGLRRLVNECHRNHIAVVLDMVYAHTDRMFPYQIGYERFFHLWYDDHYVTDQGVRRAPNPMVSAYDNFGKKNDWRMGSTQEFFAAVNAYWMSAYHIDGFRYDHVNGYLDRTPVVRDGHIDWYSRENRPTFASLRGMSLATYEASRHHTRFAEATGGVSRLIQIAEDLNESAYQLSPVSQNAINGNWEKRLSDIARHMARDDGFSAELADELLLRGSRFDDAGFAGHKRIGADTIPATVVQYIESHDECRLFYLIQHGRECQGTGFDYRNGLDDQPWWKLQPFAIALMTSVGVPMIWAGQEFAENTGLASDGLVRVRGLRPLHWDYFYTAAAVGDGATVLPLVTLYRKLGHLRRSMAALRSSRQNAKLEYCDPSRRIMVYRRWKEGQVVIVAINFAAHEQSISIPFGHTGYWVDVLEAGYGHPAGALTLNVSDAAAQERVSVPGSFGRIFHLQV